MFDRNKVRPFQDFSGSSSFFTVEHFYEYGKMILSLSCLVTLSKNGGEIERYCTQKEALLVVQNIFIFVMPGIQGMVVYSNFFFKTLRNSCRANVSSSEHRPRRCNTV